MVPETTWNHPKHVQIVYVRDNEIKCAGTLCFFRYMYRQIENSRYQGTPALQSPARQCISYRGEWLALTTASMQEGFIYMLVTLAYEGFSLFK